MTPRNLSPPVLDQRRTCGSSLRRVFSNPICWILTFFAAGLILYGPHLSNHFLWDDEEQIINNSSIHTLSNIPSFFRGSTFYSGGESSLSGIYYKPVMTLCYALLWRFSDESPFSFHLFQLLLHIGSSILLAFLLKRFLSPLSAFLMALLFLVHPMNLECVLYSADLQDTLYMFFGLTALVLLVYAPRLSIARAALIASALFLGLLSKETGALFVLAALMYCWLFERKTFTRVFALSSVVACAYAALRIGVAGLGIRAGNLQPITRVGLGIRLMTLPKIVYSYLSWFFFPWRLAIAQHWVVSEWSWAAFFGPLLLDGALFSALAFAAWRFRDKRLSFFLLLTCIGLALHAQIFPLDLTMAERWFYFPMIGLLGSIGFLIERLVPGPKRLALASSVLVAVLIALGARSAVRASDWKDGLTLFSHDVELNPEAFDLQNNLGVELIRAGRNEDAMAHLKKSVELAPYWWSNWSNLGVYYLRNGDLIQAENAYRKSISNGTYYFAYENLAELLIQEGRFAEAVEFLDNKALPILPNNPKLLKMRMQLKGL